MKLLINPSLITRIAIGKTIGLVFGLIGVVLIPYFSPEASWFLRLGVFFWYTTLGAIIGVFGVFTYHPILKMHMRWWFRGFLLGAWMNFVLFLFSSDVFREIITPIFGEIGNTYTALLFMLEGSMIGVFIDYLATKFGGEGKVTVDK